MNTTWPLATDYRLAVQSPGRVFGPGDLRAAVFPTPPGESVPAASTGGSAVVFRAEVGGRPEAVRFFTRPSESGRERYTALGASLSSNGLGTIIPSARWVDSGVHIRDLWWPLVRMDWLPGSVLDDHVDGLVEHGDTTGLAHLAQSWRDCVARLQTAGIAHGDLQHGNVLVDGTDLRLVDFDGVWLPSIDHLGAPAEQGHDAYQPPDPGRRWGPYMDTFPALVIHLSLTALSREPDLWEKYYTDRNLIFSAPDFTGPFDSGIWHDLDRLRDAEVGRLKARLVELCSSGRPVDCGLEALINPTIPPPRPAPAGPTNPWWENAIVDPSRFDAPEPTPGPPPRAEKRYEKPPAQPTESPAQPTEPPTWWYQQAATSTTGPSPDRTPRPGRRHPGKVAPPESATGGSTDEVARPPRYKRVLTILLLAIMVVMVIGLGVAVWLSQLS
ncbi:hypothetical protein [Actinomycetospora termitidis]|uniref:Aminoglycoside phosphotransferase domain-containing protein n=1 Tax=Actinomycetospora termitidis TaxID=3053470 RepID=A0ABT7MI50_9PSEU|nr:hypothetical protein [Actinomycetospora sp. Odt1-22]MDL5158983.1 hypothetical protein [Actinomycetospora sp. Odt1-22]